MRRAEQKVVQYLYEAHASEQALVRMLESQVAMTPPGRLRRGLESHLRETISQAERVQRRLDALGQGENPLLAGVGLVQTVFGQVLALGKTPLELLRGSGGEEKVLKNAKDACAAEAFEIATYTALEHLARSVGDEETARLAASIRAEEQRMLDLLLREIPRLTDAAVRSDVQGEPSHDTGKSGAADAARARSTAPTATAPRARTTARRKARSTRKAPARAGSGATR